jgi:hypothetical protein
MPSGTASIAIHDPVSIEGYKEASGLNKTKIERAKGFFLENPRGRNIRTPFIILPSFITEEAKRA